MYTDPTGLFLDTVWDIGNVVYDAGRGVKNIAEVAYESAKYGYASVTNNSCLKKQALAGVRQDTGELGEVVIDVGIDAFATMVPFVPAGGSKMFRAGKKIEKAGESGIQKIDPSTVRFTQDTISRNFKNGEAVSDLTKGLKNKSVNPDTINPIRIFEKDEKIFSLDNRRLKAFQDAGENIPFINASSQEVLSESWKFTTRNNGTSIIFR